MGPRSPSYKTCNRNPRIRWSGSNIDSTRHGLAIHTAGDHLLPAAHPAYHVEFDAFPCFKVGSVLDRLSAHKHYPATISILHGCCGGWLATTSTFKKLQPATFPKQSMPNLRNDI